MQNRPVDPRISSPSSARPPFDPGPVGLGCWAIGGPFWSADGEPLGWGEVDDRESIRAIHRALDLGVRLFDTSDVYGAGHSERVLGEAVRRRRDDILIATKFGNVFDESTRLVTGEDASPEHIRRACEASLRRLGTDHVDLYLFHLSGHDPATAPAIVETLEDLVASGHIRAYGWSTDDPERARVFARGPHCVAVEHALNVLQDAPSMLALAEAEGLVSLCRSPLAMGLLTGKFTADSRLPADDIRGRAPAWLTTFPDGRPSPDALARIEAVRAVLTSGGRTLAGGALGWVRARGRRTVPIPGFRTVAQVEEDLAAAARSPLTAAELAEIDRLLGRHPGPSTGDHGAPAAER